MDQHISSCLPLQADEDLLLCTHENVRFGVVTGLAQVNRLQACSNRRWVYAAAQIIIAASVAFSQESLPNMPFQTANQSVVFHHQTTLCGSPSPQGKPEYGCVSHDEEGLDASTC